jgi:DNA-directed RNA polymerase subunit E'/Rpb7
MPENKFNHYGHTVLPGKVICNYGQSIIDCVVRRITDHGATVEVESPLGIPEHFHLLIPDHGAPRPANWSAIGKELGLEFERPDAVRNYAAVVPGHPERRSIRRLADRCWP